MMLFQEVILSNIFLANKSSVGNGNCLFTMDKRSRVTTLTPEVKVKGHDLDPPELKVKAHDLDPQRSRSRP